MDFSFQHPETAYYVRELTRLLDVQINAIRREITLLLQMGILQEIEKTKTELGGKSGASLRKYYAINPQCIFYEDLFNLFMKDQTLGEQEFFTEILDQAGTIKLFLLTGRFTNVHDVGSDMLLVGKVKGRILEKLIKKHEKDYGFEIRYTIMTEKEYAERRYVMDKFLFSLFEGKHVLLKDELSEADEGQV